MTPGVCSMATVADGQPADDNDVRANVASGGDSTPGVLGHDERLPGPQRMAVTASFRGPLPLPSLIDQYNRTVPGLGDEIAAQWKAEAEHRRATIDYVRETDRVVLMEHYAGGRRGSRNALVLGIGVLILVALAMFLDYPAVGAAGMIATIGGIVWAMRRDSTGPPDLALGIGDDEADDAGRPAAESDYPAHTPTPTDT
jgi:uncharacterized membrane protein